MQVGITILIRRGSLAALTVAAMVAAGASQPPNEAAPPDADLVTRLVRQLDDPVFKKREEACRTLIEMGPEILPQLEKASPDVSFEIRASLEEITAKLRESLRGAVIYRVAPGSAAAAAGIRPGDVIVRVQDLPVAGRDSYYESLEDVSPRSSVPVVIRADRRLREVIVMPWRLGAELGDYDERYGRPLVSALRAFEGLQMNDCRQSLLDVQRAGMTFEERDPLLAMFLLATYCSGATEAAHKLWDDWAAGGRHADGYELLNLLGPERAEGCTHLRLRAARQYYLNSPDRPELAMDLSARLCDLNQLPEGLVGIATLLQAAPPGAGDFNSAFGWSTLLNTLDRLDLEPEAFICMTRLLRTESRPALWVRAAGIAERFGRYDRAAEIMQQLSDRWRRAGQSDPETLAAAIRLGMLAGREAEAIVRLHELRPRECAEILARLHPDAFRWSEAREVLSELTRLALPYEEAGDNALANACGVLSRQTELDPAELQSCLDRRLQRRALIGQPPLDAAEESVQLAMIAWQQGSPEDAGRLLESAVKAGPAGSQESSIEALRFLTRCADRLTGPLERWKHTRQAWHLPEGGWLLVTGDDRLGMASQNAERIAEIPRPALRWQPEPADRPILMTPRSQRVLSFSSDWLYQLREDASGWDRVARVPAACRRFLVAAPEALEEVAAAGGAPGQTMEWVWPLTAEPNPAGVFSMMRADGAWLVFDPDSGKAWWPRETAQTALHGRVDIYEVIPVGKRLERAYLLTSLGLLEWRPAGGQVQRLDLPGLSKPMAVTSSTEGLVLREGFIRIGLFPQEGGTTYIVDSTSGQVRREGCINEAVPTTSWKQMAPGDKRGLIERSLQSAGLPVPWAATQPADSQ